MKPDQIVAQIAASAGISQEQAQIAFMSSLDYFKSKLPDPVSSQVDGLMEGQEFDYYAIIKDKIQDFKEDISEKLEELRDTAKEKFEDVKDGAKGMAGKVFQKDQQQQ